jgi:NADH-quinone oxidoreductase subunit N
VFVDLSTVSLVWPEFMLILIATWMYLGGTFSRGRAMWTGLALVTYVVVATVLWRNERQLTVEAAEGLVRVNGPLIVDYLGQASRYACLGIGVLLTLLAARAGGPQLATEVLGTIMMLVAGLMLVSRANELVFLFVSLELISIPTYVLLYLGRSDRANSEATVKYFFLSIFASSLLVYGMSFLYGVGQGTTLIVGTASEPGIQQAVAQLPAHQQSLFLIGLVSVLCGLGFKLAAVPFHFYAPDVYQGTTHINAGLLAVAPKAASILALIRLVVAVVPPDWAAGWRLLAVVAMASMTWGNVCALWQTDLRRLMAFSSIAHGGYMLIGLAVALASPATGGIAATLLYLTVYVLAALGVFAALAYLSDDACDVRRVSELAGLARGRPWVAGVLAVCLFSLAGLPPLAGFWGKLTLFTGAIQVAWESESGTWGWFLALGLVGVVNAAIGAAYYLRVISAMYFTPPAASWAGRGGPGTALAMSVCGVLVLVGGLLPGFVLRTAELADPLRQQARTAVFTPVTTLTEEPAAHPAPVVVPAASADRPHLVPEVGS